MGIDIRKDYHTAGRDTATNLGWRRAGAKNGRCSCARDH